LAGLNGVSRRPHHSPNQVTAEMEAAIVAARHRWRWGPGRLRVKLCQQDSQVQWPLVATGRVFPFNVLRNIAADAPNKVWNIDYKGWFRCGDHTRVDPLTMSDGCSRGPEEPIERFTSEFPRPATINSPYNEGKHELQPQ
jgi:putative transposase